jgi:hypothetical protein
MFGWKFFGAKGKLDQQCCGNCEYFNNEPASLEELFKGINSLSSVRGSSRGDGGICKFHNRYLLPVHSCSDFVEK